jgi:hypothetical protein
MQIINRFHCGPRRLALTTTALLAVAVGMVQGSSYEVTMIVNHSGPGGNNPDHCYDVVESSEGVKVTVEELYKMELENCMDTATGGLYSGGMPLERVGPTRRELFEETLDHKEPTIPMEETDEQERQNERRLPLCGSCAYSPNCNSCKLCCYTCQNYNLCWGVQCGGCGSNRREEEVEENHVTTSLEGEMRRLQQLAQDEENRLQMASTCTVNLQETTRLLNENGNFCLGNYLDVNVVPVIYMAAE